jgi:hypothetical protein
MLTFTLIFLLSSINYASFHAFVDSFAKESAAAVYETNYRYAYQNDVHFDAFHQGEVEAPKEEDKEEKKAKTPKIILNRKLPILCLLDPRAAKNPRQAYVLQTLKNLIAELYSSSPFYQRLEAHVPRLEEELVNWMVEKGKVRWETDPLKKAAHLAFLKMDDEEAHYVYYRMLKGCEENRSPKTQVLSPPSLLKFLVIEKEDRERKVSLYGAPRKLLKALFGDESLIEEIVKERKRLYKEVRIDKLSLQDAAKEFQLFFQKNDFLPPNVDLFDFRVNTTWPSD